MKSFEILSIEYSFIPYTDFILKQILDCGKMHAYTARAQDSFLIFWAPYSPKEVFYINTINFDALSFNALLYPCTIVSPSAKCNLNEKRGRSIIFCLQNKLFYYCNVYIIRLALHV